MRRMYVQMGPAVGAVLLSGCGTICNFASGAIPLPDDPVARPAIYGGVQLDAALITGMRPKETTEVTVFVGACLLVDIPLSLVGDTLTLPITLWLDKRRAGSERDLQGVSTSPHPELHVQPSSTAMPNVGAANP